ncbi:prepilin-type N-terminal cleavage/methylation domain-containing protein [Inhella inkyongensis]|uniref:Prepilin-type N-terminal cleavage/methylation domain-containing protein n=1 Tax=Inhella inkyongensis TaxID=392593 RepID=A0A840S4H3_9BURK|nr:prepilin-type N-terminal cleavage/methylation domain-containing protein [Inhella inkyongensis]MBB5204603.1 prepilin-type N-terminal cleavage/methylation domain-containing protein [Inhella inkyongensis]
MNASFIDRRGFTLIELVAVLLLVGVLAVAVLPRLSGLGELRIDAWREQAAAGLRLAAATAVGHRRLVCASLSSSGELALEVAQAPDATACGNPLTGPDGLAQVAQAVGNTVTATPAATLYFQPNGRVSQDAAGAQVSNFVISASGMSDLLVYGQSGHVE